MNGGLIERVELLARRKPHIRMHIGTMAARPYFAAEIVLGDGECVGIHYPARTFSEVIAYLQLFWKDFIV